VGGSLMKLCSRCHLHVHQSIKACPVCGTYVDHPIDHGAVTSYPKPDYAQIKQKQKQLRYALLSIPFLIGVGLTFVLDIFFYVMGYSTGFYMTYSMAFLYILVFKTILKRQEIGSIFINYYVFLILFFLSFPSLLQPTFVIMTVLPLLSSLLLGLLMVFHWIQRRTNLLLLQGFLLSISFLILSMLSFIFTVYWPYLLLSTISGFMVIIYVVFFRVKLISSLSRFFHI
jgi:hypothetical protein